MTHAIYISLLGILLRWCVSMYPYSGAGKSPMFGDYEAQRHWQEVTVNLPVKDWYVNTTDNDLMYWGLDYPPLTAYHSFLCGLLANIVNPEFVELHKSRGFESTDHKLFMRCTVFIVDLLIYIPAAYMFMRAASRLDSKNGMFEFVTLILYPGLYLIDYGHFQYNNASLGLFVGSVAALMSGQDCIGSVLFCLALNYKQMELYHALPMFFYLLGLCFRQGGILGFFFKIFKIGLSVILTFGIIWSPFIKDTQVLLQVINRLFPLGRGLFEDKVASIWCSLSILIKVKNLISNTNMALICLLATVICMIPSSLHLFINPAQKILHYALVNSSFVFFLLSFHVHEKSILLVAIPACFLYNRESFMVTWFFMVSVVSMLPLLAKDGLIGPVLSLTVFIFAMYKVSANIMGYKQPKGRFGKWITNGFYLSVAAFGLLIITSLTVKPPENLPDLFPVLISVLSCLHYCFFTCYFHYRQFTVRLDRDVRLEAKYNKQKDKIKRN